MTPSDTQESTDAVPKGTTPTWEMELLLSGGTVFGLMQLSGLADSTFYPLFNRADVAMGQSILPLWIYAKFMLLSLVGTFLLHLGLRGYWVALVGVNSVFPGGVDWTKLRAGPIGRAYSQATTPTMATAIEQADNRATRVFVVGFGFATLMLMPILLVGLSLLISLLFKHVFGIDNANFVFLVVLGVVLGPWFVLSLIDQRWGAKLDPQRRPHRLILAALAFYDGIGVGRTNNMLLSVFTTRAGLSRTMLLSIVMAMAVIVVVLMQAADARGNLDIGDFPGLPDDSPFATDSVQSTFYANTRQNAPPLDPTPYIGARVARGPYVELFVPYRPKNHTPALQRTCPDALVKSKQDQPRAALDCLAKLHQVTLDGKPLSVTFFGSTDAVTGLPGMLAMIPIRALPDGRHELGLMAVTAKAAEPEEEKRYRIPFWK